MQERRIFLTKDEVRQLGTELTAETTDDVAILYIPLDIFTYAGTTIKFYYRTLDHNDYNYSRTANNCKYHVNNNTGEVSLILSTTNYLIFTWYGGQYGNQMRSMYFLCCAYTSKYDSYDGSIYTAVSYDPICYHMTSNDMYVRVDITRVKLPTYVGASDFCIKYKSGDIPEDTIFYEAQP